jgi:hypothetical protein
MVNVEFQGAAAPQQEGNGLAVAGMVLGILALVLFWFPFVNFILALLSIIFGAIGMSKGKRVGKGRGMGIAGLICGVISLALSIAIVVFWLRAAKEVGHDIQLQMEKDRQMHQSE